MIDQTSDIPNADGVMELRTLFQCAGRPGEIDYYPGSVTAPPPATLALRQAGR